MNNEYPIVDDITVSDTLAAWGAFKADSLQLNRLGENNLKAVTLMDKAGWK